jgi:hypothetical protein
MNRFLLITGLVLAATTAGAESIPTPRERPLPVRDLTCRGEFSMYGGAGGLAPDVRMIGTPETRLCYLRGNPEASAIIDPACKIGESCVVRARVVPRDTPNGMPQTYNVLKVYSARKESRT